MIEPSWIRDVTIRATAEGKAPDSTKVRDVMTPDVVYAFDDQDVKEAAKLMAEFTLSLEAQKLWPESGVYAARIDVDPPIGSPPIGKIKVSSIDYEYLKANAAAVKKRFSEIFSI